MSIRERISQFQENQGISNYALEKNLGVSNGYMHKCKNPSADFINLLLRKYPKLSAEWLLRGIGQMFCPTETKDINEMFDSKPQKEQPLTDTDKEKIIVSQQETIASQQETIRLLQNIIQNGMQSNK